MLKSLVEIGLGIVIGSIAYRITKKLRDYKNTP